MPYLSGIWHYAAHAVAFWISIPSCAVVVWLLVPVALSAAWLPFDSYLTLAVSLTWVTPCMARLTLLLRYSLSCCACQLLSLAVALAVDFTGLTDSIAWRLVITQNLRTLGLAMRTYSAYSIGMTKVTRRRPFWETPCLAHNRGANYRAVCVSLEPLCLSLKLKGLRHTARLPWSSVYELAIMAEARTAAKAKAATKKSKRRVSRGTL